MQPVTEMRHGLSLIQLEAEGRPSQTYVFAPAEPVVRTLCFYADPIDTQIAPFGGLFGDPGFARYEAAAVTASSLVHASALGGSGAVAWRGEVLNDSLQSTMPWLADSLIADDDGTLVRFKRPIQLPGRRVGGHWLHVFSGAHSNYAHWLSECMPKLHLFRLLREHVPDLGLLVPDHAPGSFVEQTIDLFDVPARDVIRLGPDDVVTPEVLWFSAMLSLWGLPPFVRAAADAIAACAQVRRPAKTGIGRVFIRRAGGQRRIANFDELRPVLTAFGFAVIDTGAMSLAEQIGLMRDADQVAGEHGAGMANVMFCRPGTRVLELFNPSGWQPAHWVLASACGLGYGFGIGAHVPSPTQPTADGNSDFTLTAAQLAAGLGAMARGAG